MPMPWTYRHASREFRSFLDDVQERLNLSSDNMAYTAVDGVFHAFRRRLTAAQGLRFAEVLPSVLRAIFVAGWHPVDAPPPFGTRTEMTREAQSLRPHHNLTPDNAIEATAWALRRHVREDDLDRALAGLPPGAAEFWHVDVADPKELQQRIL